MKKIAFLLLATALVAGEALASGRLSSVSVSENGTVMLTTGSPNEFKSSWAGEAGHFKMIIELPGVTVDNTAKVLGNLAANRGIKSVRFSQFNTDPPVARVVIETPERLSYSWSTKPDGVELHFMLPSPLPAAAGVRPETASGFSVPSNVFSQPTQKEDSAPLGKRLAVTPPPAGSSRKSTEGSVPTRSNRADVAPTNAPAAAPMSNVKSTTTNAENKPATVVSVATPKGTNSTAVKSVDTVAKLTSTAVGSAPPATTGKPIGTAPTLTIAGPPVSTSPATTPVAAKSAVIIKAPASSQQKDSAAPTAAASSSTEKKGTTTPAKSAPSGGPLPAPASGGTSLVVKPPSPAPGRPTPTISTSIPVEKPKGVTGATVPSTTVAGPAQTPSTAKTAGGTAVFPASSSPTAKPAVSGPPPAPSAAVTKPAATTTGKPTASAAPTSTETAAKPGTQSGSDTVDQEKFKEQLKKALGKLETPEKPAASRPVDSSQKAAVPIEKLGETSFQEQLKKALDPARSLADTGEVADIDDIDTDLPATDEEEEEPIDTGFAFPGGTFMQVSPSRKVIRYHSEGRRDPFSPLTGRDRYASGKKRRAVPAAEQLRLVGIMRSLAGNKALLEDGEGNGYILAPGDRVRNGYLVSVSENKVLFQVTEYGWTKTVAMELGSFE